MSMIFSGSKDYPDCSMYYAYKDGKSIRLEIYTLGSVAAIVDMYKAAGYTVTAARDTPTEVSSKFLELHSFKH